MLEMLNSPTFFFFPLGFYRCASVSLVSHNVSLEKCSNNKMSANKIIFFSRVNKSLISQTYYKDSEYKKTPHHLGNFPTIVVRSINK